VYVDVQVKPRPMLFGQTVDLTGQIDPTRIPESIFGLTTLVQTKLDGLEIACAC
jgi:hypothetical protein